MSLFIIILIIIVAFIIYFLPSIIAFNRNSNNTGIIFLVNLFIGWTGIAWLIILIWACEGSTREKKNEDDEYKGDWD